MIDQDPRRDDAGARTPRYKRLADELREQIRSGKLRVGQTLPGELELVTRHGVSRHTVREALRVLDELGLIDRHQGIGTLVKAKESGRSYVQSVRSPAELLQYPPESRLTVIERADVKVSRSLARVLGCAAGTSWVRISALRRLQARGTPICWVDVYVVPEYAGVAESIGKRRQLVYEMIESRYGERVASVAIEIQAGLVAPHMAPALEVAAGTPSLKVVRRYAGVDKRVFEISVSEHPADRYTYGIELKRGGQSGEGWTST